MLLLMFCMLCLSGDAAAEWYAWQDNHGRLHVTDQFATIPDDVRGSVGVLPYGGPASGPAPLGVETGASGIALERTARLDELARREARLATREAHLQLLRASAETRTAEQLRLENLLEDEIAAERVVIAALRNTLE